MAGKTTAASDFVMCLDNSGYAASLEPRKVYRVLPDKAAEAKKLMRVVDDSGEDYLFPARMFVPVQVPAKARAIFKQSA